MPRIQKGLKCWENRWKLDLPKCVRPYRSPLPFFSFFFSFFCFFCRMSQVIVIADAICWAWWDSDANLETDCSFVRAVACIIQYFILLHRSLFTAIWFVFRRLSPSNQQRFSNCSVICRRSNSTEYTGKGGEERGNVVLVSDKTKCWYEKNSLRCCFESIRMVNFSWDCWDVQLSCWAGSGWV